jgi:hypothetical protein
MTQLPPHPSRLTHQVPRVRPLEYSTCLLLPQIARTAASLCGPTRTFRSSPYVYSPHPTLSQSTPATLRIFHTRLEIQVIGDHGAAHQSTAKPERISRPSAEPGHNSRRRVSSRSTPKYHTSTFRVGWYGRATSSPNSTFVGIQPPQGWDLDCGPAESRGY